MTEQLVESRFVRFTKRAKLLAAHSNYWKFDNSEARAPDGSDARSRKVHSRMIELQRRDVLNVPFGQQRIFDAGLRGQQRDSSGTATEQSTVCMECDALCDKLCDNVCPNSRDDP